MFYREFQNTYETSTFFMLIPKNIGIYSIIVTGYAGAQDMANYVISVAVILNIKKRG